MILIIFTPTGSGWTLLTPPYTGFTILIRGLLAGTGLFCQKNQVSKMPSLMCFLRWKWYLEFLIIIT